MDAADLPTPKQLLRRGRLMEALCLWKMGIHSKGRIASILQLGGGSALARLSRDLTGLPFDDLLRQVLREQGPVGFFEDLAG